MKTDVQIQKDVMDELKWEPLINSSEIGVAVKNGIVTLSGQVTSYAKKLSAEKAAKRVLGVKAIAENIDVAILPEHKKTDAEIAAAVVDALRWHTVIPDDQLKVKVENGQVKLEGAVEWEYQRNSARHAVENLTGVTAVINLITVRPHVTPAEVQKKINAAFHRSATIDAEKITAEVIGTKVVLHGKVRSFTEKEDAENATWAAPGVLTLESKLEIEEPEYNF